MIGYKVVTEYKAATGQETVTGQKAVIVEETVISMTIGPPQGVEKRVD